ncbi:MAG TPA: hypothetical protein VEX36_11545 [Thermoleophilaceae bacterium]|nr:hypothetical protein [Thermoleophilaceae bacterium]
MRIARKLTLLAMLAIATAALAAPPALAQVEPELHASAPRLVTVQEVHAANDVPCPAVAPTPPPVPSPLVTGGGCRQHYTAPNMVLASHLSAGGVEVTVSDCTIEFDMRIDAAAEGWISHQELTGPPNVCTRKACGQPAPPTGEGRAWSFFMEELEIAGQGPIERMVVLICTEDLVTPGASHCELTIPMSQAAPHRYRFTAVDLIGHGAAFPRCELTATFDREAVLQNTGEAQAEQSVEIRHT